MLIKNMFVAQNFLLISSKGNINMYFSAFQIGN